MIQCVLLSLTDVFRNFLYNGCFSDISPWSDLAAPHALGFAGHNLNAFIMLIWTQVMKRAENNSPRIPPKKHHSFNHPGEKRVEQHLQPEQKPSYQPSRPPSFPQSREMEMAGAQLRPVSGANVPRIRVSCEPDPSELVRMAQQLHNQEARGRNPGCPNKGIETERDVVSKVCLR